MDERVLADLAKELSAFTNSTTRYSNGIVLFNMLVLYDILRAQARSPEANLSNILALSGAIAELSMSLRI